MANRIAIVDISAAGWSGGTVFVEMLARTLRHVGGSRLDLIMFTHTETRRWDGICRSVVTPKRFYGENWLRQNLRLASVYERYCDTHGVRALLCPQYAWPGRTKCKRIAWIPDFQHMRLPQFFTDAEVLSRQQTYTTLAKRSDAVMLSSYAALHDLSTYIPGASEKATVLHFPSLYTLIDPGPCDTSVPSAYHVPPKYLLVANQFWTHKNHRVVIQTLAQLAAKLPDIHLVMTGLPADHRDPSNTLLSDLFQLIAKNGLTSRITILGLVPRMELLNLMRCAALVIQPSKFEGWSTVVQDCKALGRPLICSDIPVHREQAPDALGFFDCDDPDTLAGILMNRWPGLVPGPDLSVEHRSLGRQRVEMEEYGRTLLNLCLSGTAR